MRWLAGRAVDSVLAHPGPIRPMTEALIQRVEWHLAQSGQLPARATEADRPRISDVMLRRLVAQFTGRDPRRIAIFGADPADQLADLVLQRWAGVTVIVISTEPPAGSSGEASPDRLIRCEALKGASALHAALAAYGPYDALVDATGTMPHQQLDRLRRTFFQLRRGGAYLALTEEGVAPDGSQQVDAPPGKESLADFIGRLAEAKLRGRNAVLALPAADRGFGDGVRTILVQNGVLEMVNALHSLAKMRYTEMDQVMLRRPELGSVLQRRPALTFTSPSTVTTSQPHLDGLFPRAFEVPSLALRDYGRTVCAPHQVLIKDGMLLPDTYRHFQNRRLRNRHLDEVTMEFARYPKKLSARNTLPGEYFFLGSEYPQHFGHVMTEQLSRLWAWPEAKRRFPGLKALVQLRSDRTELAKFERAVFAAAGIAPEDLIGTHGVVQVEKMLAATPMLVNFRYVDPGLAQQWDRIGDALSAEATGTDYPAKIFISRRGITKRECRNAAEVEAVFHSHGFMIISPQDYPLAEQVMMFRRAEVIGGFAGSGLFGIGFSREPKQVIMIRSESYTAGNEYLLCSIRGHRLDVIWCDPEARHPAGRWEHDAFQSGYSFDFERDGAFLDSLLADS
ncbi:hypothetical protein GCM10009841_07120 [Microlunatus panaciterrae]